jgi:hypothetical protein
MTGPPPEMVGLWLHSHEEDTGSKAVYRPSGYAFPRSRGRDGVELRPDGTLVEYDSGPDDRGRAITGRWEESGDGRMRLTVPRGEGGSSTRQILSWTPEMLVLER